MTRTALMVVLFVASVVVVPIAAAPEPVAAATCGTAWTSKQQPPEKILVLRTATGKVEKVGFKRYVAVVMASGEWPATLPPAVLEAGAVATKQYGWYYALKGNHRDDYKTSSGRCYDVRDDSRDQVFQPETAELADKQQRARDVTWGLSLRKRDKFFLTGYRRGSATKCAADADSWRLYARSSKDCAKRLDYDSERILRAYYQPGLDFVWAPGTEPSPGPEVGVLDEVGPPPADAAAEAVGLLGSVSSWFGGLFGDSEE